MSSKIFSVISTFDNDLIGVIKFNEGNLDKFNVKQIAQGLSNISSAGYQVFQIIGIDNIARCSIEIIDNHYMKTWIHFARLIKPELQQIILDTLESNLNSNTK